MSQGGGAAAKEVVARASRPCVSGCELVEIETHGRDARATTIARKICAACEVFTGSGMGFLEEQLNFILDFSRLQSTEGEYRDHASRSDG